MSAAYSQIEQPIILELSLYEDLETRIKRLSAAEQKQLKALIFSAQSELRNFRNEPATRIQNATAVFGCAYEKVLNFWNFALSQAGFDGDRQLESNAVKLICNVVLETILEVEGNS